MEDTAVINFLSNLTQLVISGHQVIAKEKDELLCLHNKIEYMTKFLKMTEEKRSQDQQVRRLVMQMRDTVFEAENIIDLFVVDAITVGDGGETDLSVKLEGIKKDIEAIEDRAKTMTNSNAEMTLVGFEEYVDRIIGKIEDGKHLQIISIVGEGGSGKTTLAEKLYQDMRTKGAFEIQAWVTVSKRHQAKDLLMDILESSSLLSLLSYTHSRDRQSLGQQLYTKLKDKKFLIVIDNIWEVETWKDIREYLPDQCNGSTVICTSHPWNPFHEDAEMQQHQMISQYSLKLLPPEECWELLQIKVFGNQNSCPEELETLGKIIADQCDGRVLAVVVIGGLLAKKEKTSKWWNHVSKRMRPVESTPTKSPYTDVLELAYNCLPLHLKACFLYLSIFPEGEEISVTILTWMIVAEGYIIQDQIVEGKTVEDIAEGYINELVDRSLLTVSRKRSDGSTKACRINVILRDFAIKKGKDESFLLHQQGMHRLSDRNRHRRLSLFDKRYLLKLPIGKCRSLVLFGLKKDPETVFADPTIAEEDAFRLLKVLDLLYISIKFPSNIGNWFHAKYLALRSEVKHLPQSFTNLSNLETLVLYSRNTVILPHYIWKMVKLRHIYNKIGIFHFGTTAAGQTAGQNISLENLQTLSPLCACKTCVDMLVRVPNIRKLQLHGKFISKSGHLVLPDLNFLMQLKSLKLTNATGCSRYTGEVITPKFPPSVRRLTLCNTLLKWEEISVLGSLENLEALKLLSNACVGSDWETSELEFPCLKYLKLKSVDLVKWVDHAMQFQNMQSLILEDCPNLEMLPAGLAQLSQLSLIEVKHCNKHVERLARKIVQQHNKLFGEDKLKTVIISKHPCASVQSENSRWEFLSSPKLSACLLAPLRRPCATIIAAYMFLLLVVDLFRSVTALFLLLVVSLFRSVRTKPKLFSFFLFSSSLLSSFCLVLFISYLVDSLLVRIG